MPVKLVRASEKAYKQLREIAKTEDVSLRAALDIVAETRDRLERKVNQLEKDMSVAKWDMQYIGKELQRQDLITLPGPKSRPPEESVLMRIPRYLT